MKNGTLYKKALRDVRHRFGSYLACAMVMAIGLMMYAAMTHVVDSLPVAQHAFYEKYRFADAFAQVHSMPASRISRLASLDGVKQASGRLTATVRAVGEDNVEVKLISYDPDETERLNDIEILEGRTPMAGANEVCLNLSFFEGQGLSIGDTVELSINGRRYDFTVCGTVWMPEYIYIVPEGSLFADSSKYGIAYTPLDVIEGILNRRGECNDVSLLFEENVGFSSIERSLEDSLSTYGLYRLTERADQSSHLFVEQEITSMRAMVSIVPIVFLFMGALIMSVVVKRTIEQQRSQIGLLKAFGYTSGEILGHYAIYGVVIGLLASIVGALFGRLLAEYMAALFQVYFYMPGLTGAFTLSSIFGLSVLALVFAVGASLYGARGVLKLSAAQAMSPPSPKHGKPILLERVGILWNAFHANTRMSLRNLFRSKSRSLTTLLGLTICYGLTTAVFAMGPMMDYMMNENYYEVQRYDMKISLHGMSDSNELISTLSHEQGVSLVEPALELPATVLKGSRSKDVTIMAVPHNSTLYRLYDDKREPVSMPNEGVVITYRMAKSLNVGVGDSILLDMAYPDDKVSIQVSGLSEQYASNNIIVDLEYLCRQLRMGAAANGAMVKLADASETSVLSDRLEDGENIASIYSVADMQKLVEEYMATGMQTLYALAAMSIFAGFAIVYNSSVVSLSERTRELASMRVMGFTLWETVQVVSTEQIVLLGTSMLIGAPLASGLTYSLVLGMSTDAYTMPYGVNTSTYLEVALCFIAAWALALLIMARKVHKTPMADVLKTRE